MWTWQDQRANLGDAGLVGGAEYPKIRTDLIHLIAFRYFWMIWAGHHCASLHNFWLPEFGMTWYDCVSLSLLSEHGTHTNTHANSIKENATRPALHYFRRETHAFVHFTGWITSEPIPLPGAAPYPHVDRMCILSFSLDMHPVRLQEVQNWQKGAGIFRDHAGENGLLLFGLNLTLVGDWWPTERTQIHQNRDLLTFLCILQAKNFRAGYTVIPYPFLWLSKVYSMPSDSSSIQGQSNPKSRPIPYLAAFVSVLICMSCHLVIPSSWFSVVNPD